MYPNDIIDKFLELRSQNVSHQRIADQLNINKSTAVDWSRRFKRQIDELKAIHFEALFEKIATTYEDELEYAAEQLHRIRTELHQRHWACCAKTIDLHRAERAIYKRLQSLRQMAELPDAPEDQPPASAQNPSISHPFPTQKTDALPDSRTSEGGRDGAPFTAPKPDAGGSPSADGGRVGAPSPTAEPGVTPDSELALARSKLLSVLLAAPQLRNAKPELEKSNKTERSAQNGTTGPLITNDLQQSKPDSFHFPLPEKPADETSGSQGRKECLDALPLPRGEGGGEGQTGSSVLSGQSSANAVHDSLTSEGGRASESSIRESVSSVASVKSVVNPALPESDKTERSDCLPYDPDLGSIVINPLECGAAIIVQKCLEAEAAHTASKNASAMTNSEC